MEVLPPTPTQCGLEVRPCEREDLPAVRAIYAHYVLKSTATFEEDPPDLDYWHGRFEEIALLELPFLVAKVNGKVVGYTFCSRWRPRPAYRFTVEDSIYISPQAVGKGIGSAMLAALLDRCREAGIREMVAVIATGGNEASLRLHRRFGFRDAGRLERVGYKFDRWLDTVLLQRSLVE
jgi:L-amino acid N-acyltransferase YncA